MKSLANGWTALWVVSLTGFVLAVLSAVTIAIVTVSFVQHIEHRGQLLRYTACFFESERFADKATDPARLERELREIDKALVASRLQPCKHP
jgi:hypothetical protein